MRALSLYEPEKLAIREIPLPRTGAREALIKVGGVGLCGTDFHIYQGHANYNFDRTGRQVPLEAHPQILGHEFCGIVEEVGNEVHDLKPGDRVIVDQGLNCLSHGFNDRCEYCASGDSHQCRHYKEHGITGLQGALAEYVAIPAVNVVRNESDLPTAEAAMAEPLGCVTHACEKLLRTPARYNFGGERSIKNVMICGAGPAGLLFTQYLRNVIGFDGLLIVSEPSESRRRLAEKFGATAIDPSQTDLAAAINDLTSGEKLHCLIESAGVGALFKQIPAVLRNQGTIVLYGHGHHGVDLGVINPIQFIEPTLVAPTGASGGFDFDGRPLTYRRSLALLGEKKIDVTQLITHQYATLDMVPQGFAKDRFENHYIKGVAVF